MTGQSQYSDAVIASMTMIFGQGFLSPGGAAEVARILDGETLAGLRVVDWGSGLGGTAMALARECGADNVLGIDIEPGNIARAEALVAENGLTDRIAFQLVEPGPLPLADGSVDLIFTKEALCHIADKAAVFADYCRVLRPGGRLIGSDWMTGTENPSSAAYRQWDDQLRAGGLTFVFTSMAAHRADLESTGFEDIAITDDSAWTQEKGGGYMTELRGPGRAQIIEAMGEAGYEGLIERCQARVDALANGDLRRCHLRARKPGR